MLSFLSTAADYAVRYWTLFEKLRPSEVTDSWLYVLWAFLNFKESLHQVIIKRVEIPNCQDKDKDLQKDASDSTNV